MAKPRRTKKKPRINLIRAADVKPEVIEWLWLDRIPRGTFTLIGGRPGEGKSLFTVLLAACVTQAGGAVVMSNPEDSLRSVKVPRLLAAEADTRLVHLWPGKCRLPQDIELLEELVLFHDVHLVTIDPVVKHVGGAKDPAVALEPLVAMAERTRCAVVGVHHINKRMPKDMHPRDAFGGSHGGWLGTARVAHILGPVADEEEDARFLATVKMNQGPDERPSVEFYLEEVEVELPGGEISDVARLVLVSEDAAPTGHDVVQFKGGRKPAAKKSGPAVELLEQLLMRGPVMAQEVYDKAADAGFGKTTMKRAATELGVLKKRVGFGKGSYVLWTLPKTQLDDFLSGLLDDK